MANTSKYAVDLGWSLILDQIGVNALDVLRTARLPLDLFQRDAVALESAEYFRLWSALEQVTGDPAMPLRLVEAMTAETFSPALFACLCSETLDSALQRLAHYKPLIGPMHLSVEPNETETIVTIRGLPGDLDPPPSLIAAELLFFVHLARLGMRDRIVPLRAESPVPLPELGLLSDWIGCPPQQGEAARIAFRRQDAQRPFLTANAAMWSAFEPSLRQRLSDVTVHTTMTNRLRGWLNETIASGRSGIAEAARDLGVSARTLQRRLSAEGTSFQTELSSVRERLARHYLTQTRLSTAEIAFLLGYSEQNSFYRAFHDWTGATPDGVRTQGALMP